MKEPEGQPARRSVTGGRSRRRSIVIFTVVSLLNVGLLTLLWVQLLTPARQSGAQNAPGDPVLGRQAPGFTLPLLTARGGPLFSLATLQGRPVAINFWSSTCGPCKDEMPLLESQWERVRGQGIVFLGIDVEDTASDGLRFLRQHGVTYSSVIDSGGQTLVSYGVAYTPETLFLDRSGRVVSAVRMEITSQQLQENLSALLR
ncbi:MAG TPA: TlpA disulfide reductase family protein [Ktedonobacteraceae bacterium]|jgi:cytochrome c biogenesis protein CcmG/thiol:disulfide interchange protein DsbE